MPTDHDYKQLKIISFLNLLLINVETLNRALAKRSFISRDAATGLVGVVLGVALTAGYSYIARIHENHTILLQATRNLTIEIDNNIELLKTYYVQLTTNTNLYIQSPLTTADCELEDVRDAFATASGQNLDRQIRELCSAESALNRRIEYVDNFRLSSRAYADYGKQIQQLDQNLMMDYRAVINQAVAAKTQLDLVE